MKRNSDLNNQTQSGKILKGIQCHTNLQDIAGNADITGAKRPVVYKVEDIAGMLDVSTKTAYNLCNSTREFKVIRVGNKIRISKDSFDEWLARSC